jgi:glycosyltransferase involved in cell wall biosynthesis
LTTDLAGACFDADPKAPDVLSAPGGPAVSRATDPNGVGGCKAGAMRIVFVMPTYYPDTFGGLERQTRILARSLSRRGLRVTILAPIITSAISGATVEDGIPVVRFPVRQPVYLGGRYFLSMLSWWIRAFAWLARHRSEYDIIAVQHVRLHAAPGLFAGMLFRKPLVGKIGRGGEHFELRRLTAKRLPFGKLVVALAKRSGMVFVANSEQIVRDLESMGLGPDRIARIPNGVEVPSQSCGRARGADGTLVFVFAGRLEAEKGVPQLLQAFEMFATEHPNARLEIFGVGPLAQPLSETIGALGLSEKVRLHGVVDDRERIYGGAAFMILPSESEGMSNTLLEAMGHGVAPIITGVSGAGDVVEDGRNGLLLSDNSPASILKGLKRAQSLDEGEWRVMSALARERVIDSCSIDRVSETYLELCSSLLGVKGAHWTP